MKKNVKNGLLGNIIERLQKKIKASYEFWVFVHKYRVKNESKK